MSNIEVDFLTRNDLKSENFSSYSPSPRTESPLAVYLSRVFPTLELPKMSELDPESLWSLIASQNSSSTATTSSAVSETSSWRPILGCGQATRAEGSEALGEMSLNAMTLHSMEQPFIKTNLTSSTYVPSAIEQMSNALESQLKLQSFQDRSRELFHRFLQASVANRHMTVTEKVLVPSSDHVAEIVGKNGLRIKQIREHLKVWVKTPTRDEQPIFEVTGLPDKVKEAVRILQQMSEHFTRVQQERQTRTEPTRVEERLWVEQDKVGLIVGASGQTIRWVQQLSDTHIATPRKQEKQPGLRTCFTISGTRERVQFAKQLISEYVALRCPGLWLEQSLPRSAEALQLVADFHQLRQTPAATGKPGQELGAAPDVTFTLATAAPVAVDASTAAAPAVAQNPVASAIAQNPEERLLQSARQLWPEAERPRRLWHSALFFGGLGLAEQRRYSADTPVSPITPAAALAAAGGAAAADWWPTPDPSAALKKAQSDERIGCSDSTTAAAAAAATSGSAGFGWM